MNVENFFANVDIFSEEILEAKQGIEELNLLNEWKICPTQGEDYRSF